VMTSIPQTSISPNDTLEAALQYEARGWSVIPLRPKKKTPALDTWEAFQTERATSDLILTWWADMPNVNVGIVLGAVSGLIVIDIDSEAGMNKAQELGLTKTPCVQTKRGWHCYYKHPGGKLQTRKLPEGLEIRADGVYVVAPPSIHPDGVVYRWHLSPDDQAIADLPAWALNLVQPVQRDQAPRLLPNPRYARAAFENELAAVRSSSDGTRNDTLNNAALKLAQLVAAGVLDQAEVQDQLRQAALECGLPESEALRTIASGFKAGLTQPRLIPLKASKKSPGSGQDKAPNTDQGDQPEPEDETIRNTDTGNARRLVKLHGETFRFVYESGKWLVWSGNRWVEDKHAAVHGFAWSTIASMLREAADLIESGEKEQGSALSSWAKQTENAARLENMVKLAAKLRPVRIVTAELDAQDHLLNCQNGTLDLSTGQLRPHNKADLLTKMVPTHYDPDAACPLFLTSLDRWMEGKTHLVDFIQRAIGYTLTTLTVEQCLFFLFGNGKNGKSTFIETMAALFGDYYVRLPAASLMSDSSKLLRNDLAQLPGARLVVTSETQQGKRLDEQMVKDLTGGDQISARFLHHEFFQFTPVHKLWMFGNHKPLIRGEDEGIWRRFMLIPFNAQISERERDPQLMFKLRRELSGILAWAVQGCQIWQRDGLNPPDEVRAATAAYRSEQDVVAAWMDECTALVETVTTPAGKLFESFMTWCRDNGEHAPNRRDFGQAMTARGFERAKWNGRTVYKGIAVRELPKEDQ
jgi:putative DNA primase/helicase